MAIWRRHPIGPLDYGRRLWIRASLLATFVFLYAPHHHPHRVQF